METKELPIGYWLKKVDELLTNGINEIHKSAGISRTEWQLMNLLHEKGKIEILTVIETLKPFTSEAELSELISGLLNEGIIEKDASTDQLIRLTVKGENLYRESFEKQKKFREKAMTGINEDEYKAIVGTLKKMVNNLT